MSEFSKLIDERIAEAQRQVRVAARCRVQSWDGSRAVLQPLEHGLPLLSNVPAAKLKTQEQIYNPHLEPGDTVLVVFSGENPYIVGVL